MIFKELNHIQCKTYLVACEETRRAALIDPERDHIDRYLALLAYHELKLDAVIDTHTHADHPSGAAWLQDWTDAQLIMHTRAPTPRATQHVDDGDTVTVGRLQLRVLYTPGHTPDSISLHLGDRVFTGDALLIGGTGRADFAGGDAGEQYDSITEKLFALPGDTFVYPAHDYRGNTVSTIAKERATNPRLAGKSRQQYIELMASIDFPLPTKIQEVLQPNQTALDDDVIKFPNLAQLNEVRQLTPQQVRIKLKGRPAPLLLDVREAEEYTGELGHVQGSRLIPLKELPARLQELENHKDGDIIAVCRSGIRSTTAAALLTGLGFSAVYNLKGGMVDWNAQDLPVEK
jgi:glyoxylase-like metal-dependent hydrolase (beta-lactamase superfamily II)/rhodanese-related sulfurtransferase